MESLAQSPVRRIARNGIVAALYYAVTCLMIFVPVLSQFGPIQCRVSELLVLLAFFEPSLTIGLTLGCFLANLTGFRAGQGFAMDFLFGTLATLIACLLEAYCSKFLFVAALWPVAINGVIVGLGELIAMAIGYALLMILVRNQGAMRLIGATRHMDVRF